MKFAHVMLALSLLMSGPALADEASRGEAAKLLDSMGLDATMNGVVTTMLDAQITQTPEMAPYREVMLAFFSKYMSYDALKSDLVDAYATEFTADELRQAREFYASATGQKFISKVPKLTALGAEIGKKHITEHLPELKQMISDETARIRKLQAGSAEKPSQK